jgi:excisionase family DNA binding protein
MTERPTVVEPAPNGRDHDGNGALPTSVARLAAATRQLAATIALTETLAQSRAELLRTADASTGRGTRAPSGQLVSLADAARRTGRHPEVLRRWCSEGRLPAVRVGRAWAIDRESLAMLMSNRTRSRPRLNGHARGNDGATPESIPAQRLGRG